MTGLPEPGADVGRFRTVISETLGLRFDDDKLPGLDQLLARRVAATRARSPAAYLAQLESGAGRDTEIEALAPELCVGETFFFRDTDQFRVLADRMAQWHQAGALHPFRVLSAGCSIGAEAYSVAITALETVGERAKRDVRIVAVDVNPTALRVAERGTYTSWALRETPEVLRHAYFEARGSEHVLDGGVRAMVQIERRNLVEDDPAFFRPDRFDVVFCRNVLMYLTPEAMQQAVQRFARSLREDGLLFLGHAENLRGVSSDFHLQHTYGTFYYARRPGAPVSAAPTGPSAPVASPFSMTDLGAASPGSTSWVEMIQRSSERIAELADARPAKVGHPAPADAPAAPPKPDPRLPVAMELLQEERFADALSLLARRRDDAAHDPDAMLLRAVLLATTGDVDAAEKLCRSILDADELNAGAHYVRALCKEHRGDGEGALEHNRIAAYLDRDFAMPHLHLGLLYRRAGDLPSARRELDTALALLAREQASRIVLFGGGFNRDGLMRLCRGELRACGGARE